MMSDKSRIYLGLDIHKLGRKEHSNTSFIHGFEQATEEDTSSTNARTVERIRAGLFDIDQEI